ncbi:MAG: hypothetical protein K9I94_14705 [Bacteroidales bacterium]|nr:hypothetical protein [Bacteroidales bacterium]
MIEYIPILTTLFAAYFFIRIFKHYRTKPKAYYLLWWSLGVLTYGIGTLTESINAVFGWTEVNMKLWYISGAFLGGYPLAQGTVYLLMKRKFADISAYILVGIIAIGSVFVILSPIKFPQGFDHGLTGDVLAWEWVRYFSPFINIYSFIFLFGGAVYSTIVYARQTTKDKRFLGNVFIAIGALLPGIGGSFTRFGYVEVLYITELIGLIFIFAGYITIRKAPGKSAHKEQQQD